MFTVYCILAIGIFVCKYLIEHPLTSEHRHSVVKALLFTRSKYSPGGEDEAFHCELVGEPDRKVL